MWPLWPLTFDRVTPNSIFSYLIIKPTLWMWWKFANPFSVMHCFMTLCYVTLDFWPPENTLVFLTSLWTYPTWWKSKHQFSNYRQIKLAIVTFDFWTHFLHYQPPPQKKSLQDPNISVFWSHRYKPSHQFSNDWKIKLSKWTLLPLWPLNSDPRPRNEITIFLIMNIPCDFFEEPIIRSQNSYVDIRLTHETFLLFHFWPWLKFYPLPIWYKGQNIRVKVGA